MQTNDIVERLRVWSDNAKEQDASEIVDGLCKAADEIERLRIENEELIDHVESLVAKCEELTLERDEARRMWCELMAANTAAHREQVANRHGWDCFKENTNAT